MTGSRESYDIVVIGAGHAGCEAALQLAQLLRRRFGPEVLGPAYPSIPRVKNLYMKDIILKIGKNGHLPEAKQLIRQSAEAMLSEPAYRSVFVSYDVDPY